MMRDAGPGRKGGQLRGQVEERERSERKRRAAIRHFNTKRHEAYGSQRIVVLSFYVPYLPPARLFGRHSPASLPSSSPVSLCLVCFSFSSSCPVAA
jgi:hypothetical protein